MLITHFSLLGAADLMASENPKPYIKQERQPNIIFIMSDDQGYGDLGATGHPHLKTPNIDKMYSESIRFTQFHVSPTCAPTRSAIMTSRYPFYSGISHTVVERERMHPPAPGGETLGNIMQSGGYKTGIFGKWHLGDEAEFQPENRGFDEVFIHGAGGIGQTYIGSCGDVPDNSYFSPYMRHNGRFVKTDGFCTDVFFEQAKDWMRGEKDKNPDKPLFTYIAMNAPHLPYYAPQEYSDLYQGIYHDKSIRNYYGMISNIDANIGGLLKFLAEENLDDETIIFYTSDNGISGNLFAHEPYNAGMRGAKGTPYEGGTRVFCMMYHKGKTVATDIDTLTMHLDLLPTFADIGHIEIPDEFGAMGQSLLPLVGENGGENAMSPMWDRFFISHVGRWHYGKVEDSKYKNMSIRNQRWKLVNNRQLYDLEKDSAETTNVAFKNPAIVKMLRAEYEEFWADATPYLVNEKTILQKETPKVNPYKEWYWTQYNNKPDDTRKYIIPVLSQQGNFFLGLPNYKIKRLLEKSE